MTPEIIQWLCVAMVAFALVIASGGGGNNGKAA